MSSITVGGDIELKLEFSQDLVDSLRASQIAEVIRERLQPPLGVQVEREAHGVYIIRIPWEHAGSIFDIAGLVAQYAGEEAQRLQLDCPVHVK